MMITDVTRKLINILTFDCMWHNASLVTFKNLLCDVVFRQTCPQ